MNSKLFIFILVILIGIILSFGYLNSAKQKDISTQELNTDQCNTIHFSGRNRIDLLFISSEDDAKTYSNLLFETEPYKNYKDYFNIYQINGNPECNLYNNVAILCNTQEVKNIEKNCPHDYTIVVKDEPEHIRSSAYANRLSINRNVKSSVFIHEMGHFFNLGEEYLTNSAPPRNSKNCQKSCDAFGDLADSCSQECSESFLYRSIVQGVMRSLITSDYGTFNKDVISRILDKNKPASSTLTGNQIEEVSSCNKNYFVDIEISQDSDSIDAISTNQLIKGCAPQNTFLDSSVEYTTCIDSNCYNLNDFFTDTQSENEEIISGAAESPPELTIMSIPYSDNYVTITNNGQTIATIDLSQAGATACTI